MNERYDKPNHGCKCDWRQKECTCGDTETSKMSALDDLIEIGEADLNNWILIREAAAELAALRARAERAEGFARRIFELADWPDGGDVEMLGLQDAAVEFGLLVPERRFEPCGDGESVTCQCAEFADADDWKKGVTCYRKSSALKGEQG